jgi:hypothetical protein
MEYYINGIGLTYQQKVNSLIVQHEAEVIGPPETVIENLVCVVDNGAFAAAARMKDDREFQQWIANDGRRKCWMIVPHVSELAQ